MRRQIVPLLSVLATMTVLHNARAQDAAPGSAGSAAPPPAAPPPPASPPPAASPVADLTTLRILHDKKIISDEEYASALRDIGESTGTTKAAEANTLVIGKWSTTMYGFVEEDNIYDSTRSFNDLAGNGQVARSGSIAGDNGRFTMGVRNSRIGFRLRAPESDGIRTSAMLEMDFFGNQPGTPPAFGEGAFFTNPTFRVRHFNFKVETPIVDVLVGQYWQLFGWQSGYHPNTVEIQGVPGQLYSRTPQIRISKIFKTDPVNVELAIAAARPVQRDNGTPDGQGGLKISVNQWKGARTAGATGDSIDSLSIGISGYVRQVKVDAFSATPTTTNKKTAGGLALDAFIPVIPATPEKKDFALSVNGELAQGDGVADFYTGLTGGIGFPALPGGPPPPVYTPNIDGGIVTYDGTGGLHFIRWQSFLVGGQFYLPGVHGKVFVSGNYSHMKSMNLDDFGAAGSAKVRSSEDWWDVNLFGDVATAVRVGAEFAQFKDKYADGTSATNNRVQLSGFFIF